MLKPISETAYQKTVCYDKNYSSGSPYQAMRVANGMWWFANFFVELAYSTWMSLIINSSLGRNRQIWETRKLSRLGVFILGCTYVSSSNDLPSTIRFEFFRLYFSTLDGRWTILVKEGSEDLPARSATCPTLQAGPTPLKCPWLFVHHPAKMLKLSQKILVKIYNVLRCKLWFSDDPYQAMSLRVVCNTHRETWNGLLHLNVLDYMLIAW